MIRRLFVFFAVPTSAVLAFACNTILDNKPAILVETEEAGTEPLPDAGTEPPPAPTTTATTPTPPPPPPPDAGTDARAPCSPAQHLCNGTCVDVADPRYGCGSPTCQPCVLSHATATCAAGACAIAACDPGFGDCDALPATGCEADLSKAATCGSCATACPPTSPLCTPSGASFACTNGCPITAPIRCGNDCVDPLTSVAHCGSCDKKCPDVPNATVTCSLGACTATCKPGFHACGATCVPSTDVTACGAACVACPPVANGKPACVAGACTGVCDPGFADCDAIPANGCEAILATDRANCGACGRACAAGLVCTAGTCVPAPDAGR